MRQDRNPGAPYLDLIDRQPLFQLLINSITLCPTTNPLLVISSRGLLINVPNSDNISYAF